MQQKFRAWDKETQTMNGMAEIYRNKKQEIELHPRDEHIILMQSSGIKDINGQEIFEGDLIKTSSAVCLVDFGEYTYLEDDETEITAIGFYLAFLNTHPVSCCPFESLFWKGCEVIGNIHENELDLIMYEAWKFNKVVADDSKI